MKAKEFRTALKEHLAANVAGLGMEDIVLTRPQSISETIATNVLQGAQGLCVTIGLPRMNNNDPEACRLSMESFYDVTLWVNPVFFENSFPEDDFFWPMMTACHGKNVAIDNEGHNHFRMEVPSADDVPNIDYLAMKFTVKRILQDNSN